MKLISLVGLIIAVLIVQGCSLSLDDQSQSPKPPLPSGYQPPEQVDEIVPNISTSSVQEIKITPLSFFSESMEEINSHAGLTDRSHLSLIRDTYVSLGEDITGSAPVYPRFTKTKEGDYLMFYHQGNSSTYAGNECSYLRSPDAVNWSFESKLFNSYKTVDQFGNSQKRLYAGAFPVTLPNGDILVVASTRMFNYLYTNNDNGLSFKRSTDGGRTWGEEQIVFLGTNWEPFVIVLPDGKIQVYYTDGDHLNPDVLPGTSNGSGVAMIESVDGGFTWTPSGREHLHVIRSLRISNEFGVLYTDQMPAILKLNGTNRLVAATESNKSLTSSNEYWISMAWSDENGEWGKPDENGECPQDRNLNSIQGCAPYLSNFPSGETLLTYNYGNVFYMHIGDETAHNFCDRRRIFEGAEQSSGTGFWGTTYLIDAHRVLAAIGGTGRNIELGQYYLNHAIEATKLTPVLDGESSEWGACKDALYIAGTSISKASMRAAVNKDSLYFIVERSDRVLHERKYTDIYLSSPREDCLASMSLRIRVSKDGLIDVSRYVDNNWWPVQIGVRAYVGYKQLSGYVAEIAVPLSKAPALSDGSLLVNFAMSGQIPDSLVPVSEDTSEWIPLLGLN